MKFAKTRISMLLALLVIVQLVMPFRALPARAASLSQETVAISLTNGRAGVPYEYEFQTSGGLPPFKWQVVRGEFPAGLTLEPSGKIRGVPTAARREAYTFVVELSDSSQPSQSAEQLCLLLVQAAPLRIIAPQQLKILPADGTSSQNVKLDARTENKPVPILESQPQQAASSKILFSPYLPPSTGSMAPLKSAVRASAEAGSVKSSSVTLEDTKPANATESNSANYEEFDPSTFIRIYEDTKRGDRILIYEPKRSDFGRASRNPDRLGKVVARRSEHISDNPSGSLPTQLAVDEDSSLVIEPIPEAMGENISLNNLFIRALLKRKDKTDELEVKNYAEVGEDETEMTSQRGLAFNTTRNMQSALITLGDVVDDVLHYVYQFDPDLPFTMTTLEAKEKTITRDQKFFARLSSRLDLHRNEILKQAEDLLDPNNLRLTQIISNELFGLDVNSLRQIAQQIRENMQTAFDASQEDKAREQALNNLLERAKLIRRKLGVPILEIHRLEDISLADYNARYLSSRPARNTSYRQAPPLSRVESDFIKLLEEKRDKGESDTLKKLIRAQAVLVYAEKRTAVAIDYLKNFFTKGYISLENADADDGNLLTLTVEARPSGATSGGAAAEFQIAIKKYGAKFYLGDSFMFLKRLGLTEEDITPPDPTPNNPDDALPPGLNPVNFAPSPGMTMGITFFKRGDSAGAKFLRALAPTVGVNVSFMNFSDPGFDLSTGKFTNTTGTDVQVGAGPIVSLFDNKLSFSYGWNLNADRKRKYFGVGFSFVKIVEFLGDKLTSSSDK